MSGIETQMVYHWDSCIYLAWLMRETCHGEDCSEGIRESLKNNNLGRNTIITSTLVFTEVLAAKMQADDEVLFRRSFSKKTHIAYDVDVAIALKAREFREKLASDLSGKKISTPDAIHLATAAIYKVTEFWTLDSKLLCLNGDQRIDGLIIQKPHGSGQRELFPSK